MSKKMTTCKACGQEIATSAKTCPHCGAKSKKKFPILIGIIAIIVVIAIVGSMGNSGAPQKTEFLVGEKADLNGTTVTLVNVTESTGSDYNKPAAGKVFVLCEFEIANNSDKEIAISSIMSFEAYCDDYACTLSFTALLEKGDKNQLDGSVAAGKKFNGVIGYELPTDWKELEVKFTPDFWSNNTITFIANK